MASKLRNFLTITTKFNIWSVFSTINLLLGIYSKKFNSKCVCYFFKFYCVLVAFILIVLHFTIFSLYDKVNLVVFEYFILVLFHLIVPQGYFQKYYRNLKTIDAVMGLKSILPSNYIMYVAILVSWVGRVAIILYLSGGYIVLSTMFMNFAIDFSHFIPAVFFSSLSKRMLLLRKWLENNSVSVNIVGKDRVQRNVRVVKKCLKYYDNLLDNMQHVAQELQFLLSLALVCNFPRWVISLYNIIKSWAQSGNPNIIFWVLDVLVTFPMIILPAIFTEMINNQVNKIKSILSTQIIQCSDDSLRFELETALQYFNNRPFSFKMYRAVPLNINLLFSIISLCITYVIVIMQLTYFSNI